MGSLINELVQVPRKHFSYTALVVILLIYWFRLDWEQASIDQIRGYLSEQKSSEVRETLHSATSPNFRPGKAKPPGYEYTQTLVVASTSNVELNWIDKELPYLKTVPYYADDGGAQFHPPRNKGHESMMYLTYIIDHYHNLSDTTIFVHPHQKAWHNNELFDLDMAETLRRLSNEHVARVGYFNLRCHLESGCPDHLHPYDDSEQGTKGRPEQAYFKKIWNELHGPQVHMPEVISAACCGQFAASRDRLQSIPLERWMRYRQWLLDTDLSDDIIGRIWEYTWHMILTGEAELCPIINYCYCDGYGLCFNSAADIDAWLALRETEFLTRDRRMEYKARNMPTNDIDWHMDQKITRPLQQRIQDAYWRGDDPETRARLSGRSWEEGQGF